MTEAEKYKYMDHDFRVRVADKVALLPKNKNWLRKAIEINSEYLRRYKDKSTFEYAFSQCLAFMDEKEEEYRLGI